jgi:DNA polymerase-3 subunit gamma/tau
VPSRAESADSATDPDAADTARLAALMPADETQLLYSLCLHGRGELGLAPDEYAALTMVLLRLLAFKPSSAAASTASPEKKTLNEAAAAAPVAPARAVPPAPAPAPVARPPVESPAAPAPAPAYAASVPAGHRLAVVDEPRQAEPRPGAAAEAPARVVGVPIRVQPPPSARDTPRADEPRSTFTPIPTSEDGDFWYATVSQLIAAEAIAALARELALQSQLVGRDTDQWLLRIERETLNQPSSREKLTAALGSLGHDVKLAIEIGSVVDSPARRNKQAADERQRVAEEAILSDPEVQALMRDFDAKIVPGTLKPA